MAENDRKEVEYYNLEGGQRHVILKDGKAKAVAPGLRLVDATPEERETVRPKPSAKEPRDYGLPV